jgi:heptose I phosphotransferase
MLHVLERYRELFPETEPGQLCALDGEVYKRIQNRRTFRIERGGRGFFIKCHQGVGWGEILKNLLVFKKPVLGAMNEWLAIKRLRELSVETMAPVAVATRGWNPAAQESLLVTEELTNCVSLEDYCRGWATHPPRPRDKRCLISRLAHIARTLHRNGVNHRDFYLCHFLIAQPWDGSEQDLHLYLIDLHRVQRRAHTPRRWVVKDVGSLWFSAREIDLPLSRADRLRFVRAYSGLPLREALRVQTAFWSSVRQRADALFATRPDRAGNQG